MKTLNWYNGNAKKPFASFEITDSELDFIRRRAKQEGITVQKYLTDGMFGILRERVEARCRALLTPNAAAVADRMARDHGLTIHGMITAAMNEVMSALEEDVAEDGGNDGGVGEQLFVREAKRAAAGKTLRWQVGESHPDHKIGSKSYADMMKADREREARLLARTASTLGSWPARFAGAPGTLSP
jgi:hypothetical protein